MFKDLYQNIVLKKPKIILLFLIISLLGFGYFSKDFRLDASSDTLLIEGDPDLKYLREINERYGAKEFLVLTYTPKETMISEVSMNNLLSLKYKIQSLKWVHNVVTLLDIPLLNSTDKTLTERLQNFSTLKSEGIDKERGFNEILNSTDKTLTERLQNFSTLKSEGIDKERGFNEILNSPVFKNFVISEDGKTTGIIVNIKKDKKLKELESKSKKDIESYKDTIKKKKSWKHSWN